MGLHGAQPIIFVAKPIIFDAKPIIFYAIPIIFDARPTIFDPKAGPNPPLANGRSQNRAWHPMGLHEAQWVPIGPKWSPKGSPKGAQRKAKAVQRHPKEAKGTPKAPNYINKLPINRPSGRLVMARAADSPSLSP